MANVRCSSRARLLPRCCFGRKVERRTGASESSASAYIAGFATKLLLAQSIFIIIIILRGKTFNVGDLVTIEFLARNIASSAELWKRKMLRNNANTIDTASRWALNLNALGSQTRGEPSSRGEKRKIPLVRDFGAREISPGGQN